MKRILWKKLLEGLKKNAEHSEFAGKMEEGMKTNSPLSMAITWEQMKRCESLSLEESYQLDTILARNFLSGKDMFEGVRAILVDKTGDPKWEYQRIEDIPREVILSYFE
ncbi:3-hydroxyisobutyryl-CoA hydrolase [Fusobacterium necrophorum subsp. necrophorum]|nr:3-hydroxyisobutyryl-CoA hydrolase [Fusobacterium necrophorum subsp. necrophorum]